MITNIEDLKKDLIVIENIKSFLIDIPRIHPDNPRYISLWNQYTKWCIDGFWAFDNGGWRYMPPTLFFYGNFWKIKHTSKTTKVRSYMKPVVRDLDWHIHYAFIEAQGFSGWKKDDRYSADWALVNEELYKELELSHDPETRVRFNDLHSSTGKRKIYIPARELLRRLNGGDYGRALYYNPAQNLQIFGCRGRR
jgi:hypothetical protein